MLAGMSEPTDPAAPEHDPAAIEHWVHFDADRSTRVMRMLTGWWWDHVYRLRIHGSDNMPATGAFVMVPNHSSYADPFLQARGGKRVVRFMAKSNLFDLPLVGRFVRAGGGFPVRRGSGDAFAMEVGRRVLLDGQPLVVYPEGTRFRDSFELGPAKRGAARLALEIGVPILPVATWGVKRGALYGRRRWQRPGAVTVFGEPMYFDGMEPTADNAAMVRDAVWARVHELYDEARRLARA